MIELPLDDTGWMAFVSARGEATGFHHPAWALLVADSYSLHGAALAMLDGAGGIVGGIPALEAPRVVGRSRRWVSLPFTDALPPLVSEPESANFVAALDAWRAERGIERLELRAALPGTPPMPVTAYTHVLPLASDPDAVAHQYASSVKRNIRASERHGITVARIDAEHDLTATYRRLHVETRRRLGVMPQPLKFFRLLWERMLSRDLGFGLLAYRGTTPVAGAVFLSWNDTAIYKFGASDSAYWNLRPNDALMAEAIRIACEQGRGRFDFGRSDAAAEGLRRFKRGWGAHESPLIYSFVGGEPHQRSGRGESVVGTIVRHSPAWVARAGGRLLYRYAV